MIPNNAQQTHRRTAFAKWRRVIMGIAIAQIVFGFIVAGINSAYVGTRINHKIAKTVTDANNAAVEIFRTPDDVINELFLGGYGYNIVVGLFGLISGVYGIGGAVMCGGNKTMLIAHFAMSFIVWFQAMVLCVNEVIWVAIYTNVDGTDKFIIMKRINLSSMLLLAVCALVSAIFVSVMWTEGVTTFFEVPDDQPAQPAHVAAPGGPPQQQQQYPPPNQPQQYPPPPQQYPLPPQQQYPPPPPQQQYPPPPPQQYPAPSQQYPAPPQQYPAPSQQYPPANQPQQYPPPPQQLQPTNPPQQGANRGQPQQFQPPNPDQQIPPPNSKQQTPPPNPKQQVPPINPKQLPRPGTKGKSGSGRASGQSSGSGGS